MSPHFLFITLFLGLTLLRPDQAVSAEASLANPGLTQQGFEVLSGEYKFPAQMDSEISPNLPTEIWAKAYWPKVTKGQNRPTVFILHGNSTTCRDRNDFSKVSCEYTQSGTCPAGQEMVPSYLGFNYLAENLASLGYVVVSINANRGINCLSGNEKDKEFILPRARLILKHIELWRKWASEGGAPVSLGGASDAFVGGIDLTQIGLIGHSRGGAGIRAAYQLLTDPDGKWRTRLPNVKFRALFEIGAIDGVGEKIFDADDVAWTQLIPMCDGDVTDFRGRLPFERMLSKRRETIRTPKSLLYIAGANHRFFNTQWRTTDSIYCYKHEPIFDSSAEESPEQQSVARTLSEKFFLSYLGSEKSRKEHFSATQIFNPAYPLNADLFPTRIDRDATLSPDESLYLRIDDFEKGSGISASGVANEANGIQYARQTYDVPKNANISWSQSGTGVYYQANLKAPGQGQDISQYATLDMRVFRPVSQNNVESQITDFSISLVDGNGRQSDYVPLQKYLQLDGPLHPKNWVFRSVRIPLRDFTGFDFSQFRGVRLTFNRTSAGSIDIANLRLTTTFDDIAFSTRPGLRRTEIQSNLILRPTLPDAAVKPEKIFSHSNQNGFEPLNEATQNNVYVGKTVSAQLVSRSELLNGQPGVEMTFRANPENPFIIQDSLPVLRIGGKTFDISRVNLNGPPTQLTFTIPQSEYSRLTEGDQVLIQASPGLDSSRWEMDPFHF